MTKVKAVLLACLVFSSVILSALIIFGRPVPRGPETSIPWFGPKPGLHEVSLPGRIYLCPAQGEAILIETFSQMYSDLVLTLGQMEYPSEKGGDIWVAGEYQEDSLSPGVLFRYDWEVSRGLLVHWLTRFYETDFPFAAIDGIFVPLDGGPVKYFNSVSHELWQLQTDLPLAVFQQAVADPRNTLLGPMKSLTGGEVYAVDPGVFDLAAPRTLSVPACQFEEVQSEEVVQSFFLNPSIIREADGTEIYTDGFGALRLFPWGAVEYTAGGGGSGETYYNQQRLLEGAIEFLHLHGGWPGRMLPVYSAEGPAEPARLEFSSFLRGLPVTGERVGIALDFSQGQVVGYRRFLLVPAAEGDSHESVKPFFQLLSADTQVALFFAEEGHTIHDLALVYYYQQNRLIPVWRVRVENQVMYVAAGEGRILQVKAGIGGH